MRIVMTNELEGPFGLVVEDMSDRMYRGFSISPIVIGKAIKIINEALRINIDLLKK